MLWVGLTGGIGAGKSAASRALAELGAYLVDADVVAREVVAPGTEGLAAVVEAFGQQVLRDDGSLDREGLGRIVFGDDDARRRLNGIVHPRIGARTAELAEEAEAAGARVLLHDVPLLVEGGLGPAYHLVVVVDAPVEERLRRLVRLRGMAEEDARARIAAQADDQQRAAAADVLLRNDSALERLSEAAAALWEQRLLPYADNLAAGRPAPRPAVRVRDADPQWAAQGRRLAERVRFLTGAPAEHVGPTAVPGLPAPDVVEVQAEVDDVEAARAALARGGFFPTGDGTVLHGADPGRAVDVALRPPGDRRAVAVRDRLRSDPAARERVCRAVVGAEDESAYAEAYSAAVGDLGGDSEQ